MSGEARTDRATSDWRILSAAKPSCLRKLHHVDDEDALYLDLAMTPYFMVIKRTAHGPLDCAYELVALCSRLHASIPSSHAHSTDLF